MKSLLPLLLCLLAALPSASAQLTLDACRQKAHANYPLIRKYSLIEQTKNYDLANAAKAWLPQFQLNARATYQSEVTNIPLDLSALSAIGISLPSLPSPTKDQYQATLEATQILYDGGALRAQQALIRAGSELQRTQLQVEIYTLNERIDQLFFGILLLDAQIQQNTLLTGELERNLATVKNLIANGLAQLSDHDLLQVELLNAAQIHTQLQSSRRAYLEMLAIMLGEPLDPDTHCLPPPAETPPPLPTLPINRPELQFFQAQNTLLNTQKALLRSSLLPKLGLFLQGGYGRPGLNMLSDDFDLFYLGGIRLTWNPSAHYTQKNDLHKIEISKNATDAQRDLFLYNTRLAVTRENQEIDRLRRLLLDDDQIIALRQNIRTATQARLAAGTATVPDLLRELTHENLAKQAKNLHQITLLAAIHALKSTTNN
jgi:outer membrane protein TolC